VLLNRRRVQFAVPGDYSAAIAGKMEVRLQQCISSLEFKDEVLPPPSTSDEPSESKARVLDHCKNLRVFRLVGGRHHFSSLLPTDCTSLRHLVLAVDPKVGLLPSSWPPGVSRNLWKLELSGSLRRPDELLSIDFPCLHTLSLSFRRRGVPPVKAVLDMKKFPSLRVLKFSGCTLELICVDESFSGMFHYGKNASISVRAGGHPLELTGLETRIKHRPGHPGQLDLTEIDALLGNTPGTPGTLRVGRLRYLKLDGPYRVLSSLSLCETENLEWLSMTRFKVDLHGPCFPRLRNAYFEQGDANRHGDFPCLARYGTTKFYY